MITLGKLRKDGSMHYYDSVRSGGAYNANEPIYLISKGGHGTNYDWWTVGGTIYFGYWKKHSKIENIVDLTTI